MLFVRLYVIDSNGHIRKPPEVVECLDDEDALSKATERLHGETIEIWDQGRLVGKLPAEKPRGQMKAQAANHSHLLFQSAALRERSERLRLHSQKLFEKASLLRQQSAKAMARTSNFASLRPRPFPGSSSRPAGEAYSGCRLAEVAQHWNALRPDDPPNVIPDRQAG
jgi:hypothetical protein